MVSFGAPPVGGPAVTVATTTPGQNATVTFEGTAGQQLGIELTGSTFGSSSNANVLVRSPDGSTLVTSRGFGAAGVVLGPVTLVADGTYTVAIDPQSTVVGQVAVRAYAVSDPTAAASR